MQVGQYLTPETRQLRGRLLLLTDGSPDHKSDD